MKNDQRNNGSDKVPKKSEDHAVQDEKDKEHHHQFLCGDEVKRGERGNDTPYLGLTLPEFRLNITPEEELLREPDQTKISNIPGERIFRPHGDRSGEKRRHGGGQKQNRKQDPATRKGKADIGRRTFTDLHENRGDNQNDDERQHLGHITARNSGRLQHIEETENKTNNPGLNKDNPTDTLTYIHEKIPPFL